MSEEDEHEQRLRRVVTRLSTLSRTYEHWHRQSYAHRRVTLAVADIADDTEILYASSSMEVENQTFELLIFTKALFVRVHAVGSTITMDYRSLAEVHSIRTVISVPTRYEIHNGGEPTTKTIVRIADAEYSLPATDYDEPDEEARGALTTHVLRLLRDR